MKHLAAEMLAAAKAVESKTQAVAEPGSSSAAGPSSPGPSRTRVPPHLHRARVEEANEMIETQWVFSFSPCIFMILC